jgi:hypothetical protein
MVERGDERPRPRKVGNAGAMPGMWLDDTEEEAEARASGEGRPAMSLPRRGRKRAVLTRAVPRDEVKVRQLRRKLRAIEMSELTELERMVHARPFH